MLVSGDLRRPEMLANHVHGSHGPGNTSADDSFGNLVHEAVVGLDRSTVSDSLQWRECGFVKPACIGKARSDRHSRRYCKLDGIPGIVMKRAGDVIYGFIAILFKHCLNLGNFPSACKEALLVSIQKPGSDSGLCGSCRAISLVLVFGKLFEYLILNRIRNVVKDRNLLRDCQFGFSPGHFTLHALTTFADFVVNDFARINDTVAVILNLDRAFDSVCHEVSSIISKRLVLTLKRVDYWQASLEDVFLGSRLATFFRAGDRFYLVYFRVHR